MAAAAMIAASGCALRHQAASATRPSAAALYRARLSDGKSPPVRFRLLLWAELADRVHAEVLSPLGSPEVVVDGGQGRLALTLVREGLSYAGAGSAESLELMLGVPLSLAQLVQALLTGAVAQDACRVERGSEPPGFLPSSLSLCCAENCLQLVLKRRLPERAEAAGLGTGEPPPGTTTRPLAELDRSSLPWGSPPN